MGYYADFMICTDELLSDESIQGSSRYNAALCIDGKHVALFSHHSFGDVCAAATDDV